MIRKISQDYPFRIQFKIDGVEQSSFHLTIGSATQVEIIVSWEYETGVGDEEIEENDTEDTIWGNLAYDFMNDPENEGISCIQVQAKIKATQIQQAPSTP